MKPWPSDPTRPWLSVAAAGDFSGVIAVSAGAPRPSLTANISSRLRSSSEICSTLRFVSAAKEGRKERKKIKTYISSIRHDIEQQQSPSLLAHSQTWALT